MNERIHYKGAPSGRQLKYVKHMNSPKYVYWIQFIANQMSTSSLKKPFWRRWMRGSHIKYICSIPQNSISYSFPDSNINVFAVPDHFILNTNVTSQSYLKKTFLEKMNKKIHYKGAPKGRQLKYVKYMNSPKYVYWIQFIANEFSTSQSSLKKTYVRTVIERFAHQIYLQYSSKLNILLISR
jgi:hypothetical protein